MSRVNVWADCQLTDARLIFIINGNKRASTDMNVRLKAWRSEERVCPNINMRNIKEAI